MAGLGAVGTRYAESAVCIALAYKVNNKGKDIPLDKVIFESKELDKKVDLGKHDTKEELKAIYKFLKNDFDKGGSWYDTTLVTAQKLYTANSGVGGKLLKSSKYAEYNFHRDSTFMNSIYSLFNKNKARLKKTLGLSIGGDKWNPGDIWISTQKEFPVNVDLPSIERMNARLFMKWEQADIMGISLKKLGKNPTFSVYNLPEQKHWFPFIRIESPNSPLGSKDMYITAGKANDTISIQIRTFGRDNNVQCEIKGASAAGGKAGFGITKTLLRKFILDNNINYTEIDEWKAINEMVGEVKTNEEPMKNEEKILGIINKNYSDLGMLSPDMRDELSRKTFINDNRASSGYGGYDPNLKRDFFVSKIQSTTIAVMIKKLSDLKDKTHVNTFISALFSYAHSLGLRGLKEGFEASIYGKVY
jgi:hypothetical protein